MIELAVEFLLETGTLLLKAYGDSRDEKKATMRPEGAPKVDLSPLIDSIEHLQTSNEEIVDVLRHPSRTAGDEMLDRANLAFKRGWYVEAQRDATESVRLFPFRPAAQLLRALSSLAVGDAESTVSALSDTMRYAVDEELPIGCSAALIAANLADAVGGRSAAVDVLREFRTKAGGVFPEVLLALHLRIPDDDECLTALVAALVSMGLDVTDPPRQITHLTPQLGEYLQRGTAAAAAVEAANTEADKAMTDLRVISECDVAMDPRLLAFLCAMDGVATGNRKSYSVKQILRLYTRVALDNPASVDIAAGVIERINEYESLDRHDIGSITMTVDLAAPRRVLNDYMRAALASRASKRSLARAKTHASRQHVSAAATGPILHSAYPVPLSLEAGSVKILPDVRREVKAVPALAAPKRSRSGKGSTAPKVTITPSDSKPADVESWWAVDIRFGDDEEDWFSVAFASSVPTRLYRNGTFLKFGKIRPGLTTQVETFAVHVGQRAFRITCTYAFRWLKSNEVRVVATTLRGDRPLESALFLVNF
ncbi:hypothetical protein ACI3KY_01165 [Microbacterium sp. ZW T2_14]|uniref:hypothetical protein n=1 Tax=Microbacterium sp. ZW T2_14 TaxID=3378079 RepID=UPI003853D776